jgi:6-phosphogluconolactonase
VAAAAAVVVAAAAVASVVAVVAAAAAVVTAAVAAVVAAVAAADAGNQTISLQGRQVRQSTNLAALSKAAAEAVAQVISRDVKTHGACNLALAGGSTPARLYRELANPTLAGAIPWQHLECFFGDERVVARDHPDSNYRLAFTALLDKVPIPASHIHPMISDPAQPLQDAQRYTTLLDSKLPKRHGQPCFDLILLGMGSDGHTASLFANSSLLQEQQQSVIAGYVDKLAAWRISLTLPVLNAARRVFILVSGADKAAMLKTVFTDPAANVPIQQLQIRDEVIWFVDAAAGKLLCT